MINFLMWNIQGAASSSFRDHLRRISASANPSIGALMETRMSGMRADRIVNRLGFQSSFRVEAQGFSGGIWLLWNGNVHVHILSVSNQFIHMKVQGIALSCPLILTVVYASPQVQYRRYLWDQLSTINPGLDHLWLIGGDFNAILHLDDRRGGQVRRLCISRDFQSFVFSNALQEVEFKEPRFTWARGDLYERLDRCMVNLKWMEYFPNSIVRHLDRIGSDHRPILLCMDLHGLPQVAKPFRFVQSWQASAEFTPFLEKSWDKLLSLDENISNLQQKLPHWQADCIGSLGKRKRRILARLKGIDKALGHRYSRSLSEPEKVLKGELDDILAMEESEWRQKARCDWIDDGDRNTKYYHAMASGRRKHNTVVCLKDDSGNWVSDPSLLKRAALDFYTKLFSSEGSSGYAYNCRGYFRGFHQRDLSALEMVVSREEISSALFQMSPSKAPGIDGFHASFYQKNWSIVGDVVCKTIQRMFSSGVVDPDLNRTLLVLLPKVDSPESISQFQPIGLCTVVYKILSKVVVNRLKPFLPDWITENQTSFVPGRSITDNIVIAQEIIHSMRTRKGKMGWFDIKVDLEKAYDRLEWSFIDDTLSDIGVPDHLRSLIMSCVSSVSTQILWNGDTSDSFKPTRGIHQGDPLSPYLFVLCMERLAQAIQREVDQGTWKAFQFKRNGPLISHLFFADDLVLFAEASLEQFDVVSRVLREFCECSGHKVSISKTNIFFSPNIHIALQEDISDAFGFQCVSDLGRYLGVPLIHGRVTKATYRYVIQKVADRLAGWKVSLLSFAGCIVLAKSVLSSIPMYVMQSIRLPRYVCDEIERLIRNFIWGHSNESKGSHAVNWTVVCSPISEGGLGIKRMEHQNSAFLLKLGFIMVSDPSRLWVKVMRAKYGIQEITPTSLPNVRGSRLWQGIRLLWSDLRQNIVWNVGDGKLIDFWNDAWVSSFGPLVHHVSPGSGNIDRGTVKDMVDEGGQWKWGELAGRLPETVLQGLAATKPPIDIGVPDYPG
ncbi:hypothetical protein HRI_003671500 [Hibiscus trionum]|uniref:Reverse transcriptase domain-containing protein n=1 Tax=Hibiscus trionum TaxID=183268 RepID=A0A9W7MDP0_HIBTR|nr:hypothetical protein HRI_003671500 [Hibiscus trionum]